MMVGTCAVIGIRQQTVRQLAMLVLMTAWRPRGNVPGMRANGLYMVIAVLRLIRGLSGEVGLLRGVGTSIVRQILSLSTAHGRGWPSKFCLGLPVMDTSTRRGAPPTDELG